ncbi:PfkB family carbohydrate kinase [Paenibacillus radicis (ex Gao et al. 2016)]|uniref:Sugar kinase YdjE n=1 Tax=Paenibacillus radicis (ex Gao et al. 2016) TaxID=1737354 RepID=A0A917GQ40_9BACL|nr:PfkB family carbohydrate kinase [Paenibacillus radicis (ex Gao et al. 2016)]GGG54061.1 putative sugar kinase YdjE [Paenibacillus radicis (ex Gao et al. 2016)]
MKLDVICLGELLIDFVSTAKDVELIDSPGFVKAPGGAPANVAAGVVKLGGTAGFIGKVGDDPFGHYLKRVLDELTVDTNCLALDREARTTLSFVAQKPDGDRDCMFYRHPGADMLLSAADIDEAYMSQGAIFHYGSISLGSPSSKEATLQALAYAREHGLLISYDPNLRMDLWPDQEYARKEINEGFGYADIVKISEEEFRFITGCSTVEECGRYIMERGPKLVIVTLGKDGCYYTNGELSGYIEGFKAEVVETTGAGDAFVAAVLQGLAERKKAGQPLFDEQLPQLLQFANAAASLATTRIGAIPSLPTREEALARLG